MAVTDETTTTEPPTAGTPVLGREGETCRSCQATLAVDQRYCLNCGQRRGEQRLPFADIAFGAGAPPPAPPPVPAPDRAPLVLLAGLIALLLALGVGVLLGRSGRPEIAADTPVVNITAPAAAPAAVAPPATTAPTAAPASPSGQEEAGADGTEDPEAETLSDDQLKAPTSQKEAVERSKKLPEKVQSEGAPPPKDGGTPGGGTDEVEEIE